MPMPTSRSASIAITMPKMAPMESVLDEDEDDEVCKLAAVTQLV